MSDFYTLSGKSLFTILSIAHFTKLRDAAQNRSNADADAEIMRSTFEELGLVEFGLTMGNMRRITKKAAVEHISALSVQNLASSDMVVLVISTHGRSTYLGQYIVVV